MKFHAFAMFCLLVMSFNAMSQGTPTETSDPRARTILDRVQDNYRYPAGLAADFTIIIESGDLREEQRGKVFQSGDKFHIDMDNQLVISDGQSIWFYLKNRNEVQITSADESEDNWMLNPANLLKIYQDDDKFIYGIVGEANISGHRATLIEFKPTDRNAEYSKIRAAVAQQGDRLIHVIVFGKDGIRYTIAFDQVGPLPADKKDVFTFRAANYPGVHIEDLRW